MIVTAKVFEAVVEESVARGKEQRFSSSQTPPVFWVRLC